MLAGVTYWVVKFNINQFTGEIQELRILAGLCNDALAAALFRRSNSPTM